MNVNPQQGQQYDPMSDMYYQQPTNYQPVPFHVINNTNYSFSIIFTLLLYLEDKILPLINALLQIFSSLTIYEKLCSVRTKLLKESF